MSLDASNDLFKAVRAALLADTWLASQVGTRIFSSWDNQDAQHPIIRMKTVDVRPFEMDGMGEGSETDFWVHIFTAEASPIVCSQIAEKVRTILNRAPLSLDGSDAFSIDWRRTIPRKDDQSPSLQMAVVQFTAYTAAK